MIKTKQDLREYIAADNAWYRPNGIRTKLIDRITANNYRALKQYLVLLRKTEYHLNNSPGSRWHTYHYWYFEGRRSRLGQKLGIEIFPNCFGKGLSLWHTGIVVNPSVRAGEGCVLRGSNCIGNNGTVDLNPVLGDRVQLGFGAVIIGDVSVASDTIIGANAVLNRSVDEAGGTYVGVPARRMQSETRNVRGTEAGEKK